MIFNRNSVRTTPSVGVTDKYHDVEEKEVQIRSEVMDVDGHPSGIINMSTVHKLVPKDNIRDTDIQSKDFDLQNLIDAGVDPSKVGDPAHFFMHKNSDRVITDIVGELSKHKGKFFDEVKKDIIPANSVVETIVNDTNTNLKPQE